MSIRASRGVATFTNSSAIPAPTPVPVMLRCAPAAAPPAERATLRPIARLIGSRRCSMASAMSSNPTTQSSITRTFRPALPTVSRRSIRRRARPVRRIAQRPALHFGLQHDHRARRPDRHRSYRRRWRSASNAGAAPTARSARARLRDITPTLTICAPPGCPIGAQLIVLTGSPDCWDGVNLDTADHRSHLVYGTGTDYGPGRVCDAAHPYVIPQIARDQLHHRRQLCEMAPGRATKW